MSDDQKETVNLEVSPAALGRHAWRKFRPKVTALRSLDDALAFAATSPPAGTPSHPFYANLATFLMTLSPPPESTPAEWDVYGELVGRLAASAELSADAAAASLAAIARLRALAGADPQPAAPEPSDRSADLGSR